MSTWRVECGDCLELLKSLPDGSVDAVVTDPPYFRVKDEQWDRQWKDADAFLGWIETVVVECRRVLAPNGSIFVFTSPDMNTRIDALMRRSFRVLNNIRWIKEAGWHKKAERASLRSWLSPWEGIIFAEQFGDQYEDAAQALHKTVYAPIGRAVQTKRMAAGLQRWQVDEACAPSRKPTGLCYRWEEGACLPTEPQYAALCRLCGDRREYEDLRREYEDLRREYEDLRREYEDLRREYEDLRRPFTLADTDAASDCWRFSTVPPRPDKHPCEKPVPLLRYMIESVTREGATVLDPFCGSGATGSACSDSGRNFIGIEIDPGYCEIARRRIAEAVPLFAGASA